MNGEQVNFECNGESYIGYLSKPASGGGPGVIVIQEWWGLVGHIRHIADRFAAAGFIALAPDFFKGEVAREPEAAEKLMMALNISETEQILRCAIARLIEEDSVSGNKVGVVGFCMGGQLSLFAAATNPSQIGACVDFYGIHPHVVPPLAQLQAPVLGIFAEHDDFASPDTVKALDQKLQELGKEHVFHTYPGTHHAFFNDDRPEVYDPEAAGSAWIKTLEFLKAHL